MPEKIFKNISTASVLAALAIVFFVLLSQLALAFVQMPNDNSIINFLASLSSPSVTGYATASQSSQSSANLQIPDTSDSMTSGQWFYANNYDQIGSMTPSTALSNTGTPVTMNNVISSLSSIVQVLQNPGAAIVNALHPQISTPISTPSQIDINQPAAPSVTSPQSSAPTSLQNLPNIPILTGSPTANVGPLNPGQTIIPVPRIITPGITTDSAGLPASSLPRSSAELQRNLVINNLKNLAIERGLNAQGITAVSTINPDTGQVILSSTARANVGALGEVEINLPRGITLDDISLPVNTESDVLSATDGESSIKISQDGENIVIKNTNAGLQNAVDIQKLSDTVTIPKIQTLEDGSNVETAILTMPDGKNGVVVITTNPNGGVSLKMYSLQDYINKIAYPESNEPPVTEPGLETTTQTTTTSATTTTATNVLKISCDICQVEKTCTCKFSGTCTDGTWMVKNKGLSRAMESFSKQLSEAKEIILTPVAGGEVDVALVCSQPSQKTGVATVEVKSLSSLVSISNFGCRATNAVWKCGMTYTNGLSSDMAIVYYFAKEGKKSAITTTQVPTGTSVAYGSFYCTDGPGDYKVSWTVFRASDVNFENPIISSDRQLSITCY